MQNDERNKIRTKRFALSVIRTFSMIPKTTETQILGKQLLRSSTSVGATTARHIASAVRRSS